MPADDLDIRLAWERHVGRGPAAADWLATVLRRHREPHRHYHGVRHVAWTIRHLDGFHSAGLLADPGVAVAAACFHDIVYEPTAGRGDNERASAALAQTALTELGWAAGRVGRAVAAIEATIDHDVSPDAGQAAAACRPGWVDRDRLAVLAADLAVLAADPAGYGDYVRAVRREYAHLDDRRWRIGRAEVVRGLLARARLFPTGFGIDRWEARARANLTAELADLER